MFEKSFRKLTGTVAAVATALALMTAAAVPARAEINDTARIVGGVAAIALGAKIYNDSRRDKEREARDNNNRWDRDDDHDRGRHRGHDKRDRDRDRHQARLPERCISDYDRRRGEVIAVYNEQCLRQHARR